MVGLCSKLVSNVYNYFLVCDHFDNDRMGFRRISQDRGTVTVDPAVTITMLNTFPPRDSPFTSKIIWH